MPVEIRSATDNARLRYTLGYLFGERLGINWVLNPENHDPSSCVIGYGIAEDVSVFIPDSGFLQAKGVSAYPVSATIDAGNQVLLFPEPGSPDVPFDVFSAIFFMLSRHEEYTCPDRDKHGRFDVQHSLAYQYGFHQRAVVDEWIILLRERLAKQLPETLFKTDKPSFSLTVDVDMLFSYRTKGFTRNVVGWLRDFAKGRFGELWERPAVLLGLKQDPFDSFGCIDSIRREYNIPVTFFILAAAQRTAFDKNGKLSHPKSLAKLNQLAENADIGLHPSYYCLDDDSRLMNEKRRLSDCTRKTVTAARRHYLRMTLPESYRQLVRAGFTTDHTMGYASGHGFRAGTSRPFSFFDIETNQVLPLTVVPFCVMDGSLIDYEHLSPEQSEAELLHLAEYVKSIGGRFEMLVHNETFSENKRWQGWTAILRKTLSCFQNTNE